MRRQRVVPCGVSRSAVSSGGSQSSDSVTEANARILTEEQGIQDIAQAMTEHADKPEVLELACAALWSLSVEDENVDLIFDLGCVGMMVKALAAHKEVLAVNHTKILTCIGCQINKTRLHCTCKLGR